MYLSGCEQCMEFSLSLDQCGNSSFMLCELGLYILLAKGRGFKLLHLLTWMVWHRLSSSCCCCIPFIVLESAVSGVVFSAVPSLIFIWGGSKYCPSLQFKWMQLPHGTWCWYLDSELNMTVMILAENLA